MTAAPKSKLKSAPPEEMPPRTVNEKQTAKRAIEVLLAKDDSYHRGQTSVRSRCPSKPIATPQENAAAEQFAESWVMVLAPVVPNCRQS
jgi:hypothetical protein